jgi:hypothetical protein
MMKHSIVLLLFAFLLGACSGGPSQPVTRGALLIEDDFNAPGQWDTADVPAATVEIADGVFHFDAEAGRYIFSVDYRTQIDTVTEATARLWSEDASNGFGIICRANADGEGYYFLIGGDGSGTIRRSAGREVKALAAWTQTGAVITGGAQNRIRAVCDGDYLALYVNDQFVAEARDSLYGSGYTGFVVVTTRERQRVEVDFDALRVYAAE